MLEQSVSLRGHCAAYRRAQGIVCQYFPAYWRHLALSLLLLALLALLNALTPWLLGRVVDALTVDVSWFPALAMFLAAEALRHVLRIGANINGIYYTHQSDAAMTQAIFAHVGHSSHAAQRSYAVGALLADINRSKGSFSIINNILLLTVLPLAVEIAAVFAMVANMVGAGFAVVLCAALCGLFALACRLAFAARPLFAGQFAAQNRLQGFLASRLSLLSEAALNQARADDCSAARVENEVCARAMIAAGKKQMGLHAVMMAASWLVLCVSLAWLLYGVRSDAGVFVALAVSVMRLTEPFIAAAQHLAQLGGQFVALEQGLRYLQADVDRRTNTLVQASDKPWFALHDVRLARLSIPALQLHRGQMTVITGASGLGKSSLLNALCARDKSFSGTISFKGNDVRHLGSDDVLDEVAVISQHPALIPAGLHDNLLWGNDDKNPAQETVDEVIEALGLGHLAARAQLDGASLSGGEKQRLAIARAILKGRAAVIADEPTAAQDEDHAQKIIAALRRHFQTVIVFAHDARVVTAGDCVIALAENSQAAPGGITDCRRHEK